MAAKFGFYANDELKAPILMIDRFPTCLDRNDISSTGRTTIASKLLGKLPVVLTGYYEKIIMDMWGRCTTLVGILIGIRALEIYQTMLSKRIIEFKVIYLNRHLKRHQPPRQNFCPPSLNQRGKEVA